jgi:hypothetical protein
MRSCGLWLGAVLGLLVGAGSGRAQELELKYKMKPGQEFQYRDWLVLASQTFGEGVPEEARYQWETEALYQQRVVSLENGVYELENRTLSGKITTRFGDRERTEEMKEKSEVVTLDERGKVLGRKGENEEEERESEEKESLLDPNLILRVVDDVYENLLFPPKAVKIGETWIDRAEIQLTPENRVSVDLSSKVARLVKVRGRRCAEIKTHFVVPLKGSEEEETASAKASVEGQVVGDLTLYFDYEAGVDLVHLGEVRMILNTVMEMAGETQENQSKTKLRLKTVLQPEK